MKTKFVSQLVRVTLFFSFWITAVSCDPDRTTARGWRPKVVRRYPIMRSNQDVEFPLLPPWENEERLYPWDQEQGTVFSTITKENFRCKGGTHHRLRKLVGANQQVHYIEDCQGGGEHPLPLQEGKEFIYPVLIDLLNHLQKALQARVVITSGHRCPQHQLYISPKCHQAHSKHLIGYAVDFIFDRKSLDVKKTLHAMQKFYAKNNHGLEDIQFYTLHSDFSVQSHPISFGNQEIRVTFFPADTLIDGDNTHAEPFARIEVLYDRFRKQKVFCSWEKALRMNARFSNSQPPEEHEMN